MKAARQHSFEDEGSPGALLLFPAQLSALPLIGSRLHAYAGEVAGERGEAKEVHDLRLAVQGACANVIKHGRMSAGERRLVVRFEFAEGRSACFLPARSIPARPMLAI